MGLYDKSIGAFLLGISLNTYLYGLVTYQFALYYRMKFDDPPARKYTVLFLFIWDTLHSASVIYLQWHYTVANYGNPAALAVADWSWASSPLANAVTALVTQIFLGYRIWCLTNKNKILYGVVILLAAASFILCAFTSIKALIAPFVPKLIPLTPLVIVWLSLQSTVDMFITVTLVIALHRSRADLPSKMGTVMNQIIRGTIQTGLFATIFSMGDLITTVVSPDSSFHCMFGIPIGRIYTNTLLDTLLARKGFREELVCMRDIELPNDTPVDAPQASTTIWSTNSQLNPQRNALEA